MPPGATVATEGYAGGPEMTCLNPKASQSPFELALAVWADRIGLSSPVNFQFLLRHWHSIASWRCMSTTVPVFHARSVPCHCFADTFGNISVNCIQADWEDQICIHTGRYWIVGSDSAKPIFKGERNRLVGMLASRRHSLYYLLA